MENLTKAKELENTNPHEALKMFNRSIKDNQYISSKIIYSGIFSAILGYAITYTIFEQLQLKKILILILLGLTAFMPPFLVYIHEKFKALEQKWQKNSTKFMSGFFMFLSVVLMPVFISMIIAFGTLLLAGPFVFLIKLIINQPFETMPKIYRLIFGIPAAIITISYLLSPNRGFSSPFPLGVLFKDAITAIFLGFRKILGIIVGTLFCLSFYWFWKNGFEAATLCLVLISGILSGFFLNCIDKNLNLAYELYMYRARVLMKMGHKYQARYWLSEAAGMLSEENVSEDTKKELIRLATELKLDIRRIL